MRGPSCLGCTFTVPTRSAARSAHFSSSGAVSSAASFRLSLFIASNGYLVLSQMDVFRLFGDASAHACLRIRSRLCHVPDSEPCGCRSPAMSIGKKCVSCCQKAFACSIGGSKADLLELKEPEQWGHLDWRVRCSAISTRCMNVTLCRPRPPESAPNCLV
jgi:hypothetical protein